MLLRAQPIAFSSAATHTRGHRVAALLSILSTVLEVYCDLQQPYLMSLLVDEVARSRDMSRAMSIGEVMLLYSASGMIAGVLAAWFANSASLGFAHDLRRALFVRIQSFEAFEFDRLSSASLITRLTNDTSVLQQTFALMLQMMVRAPLLLVGGVARAIAIDLQLALVLLGAVPLIVAVLWRLLREGARRFRLVQTLLDGINRIVRENLRGIRIIKAHNRVDDAVRRFRSQNREFTDALRRALFVAALFQPVMALAVNLCVATVLILAGRAIVAERLALGEAMAFVTYLTQILMSLMMLSMLFMQFSRSRSSYERVNEVLATTPSLIRECSAGAILGRGRIQFHGVSFAYGDGGHVLSDLSFVIEPGTRLGIVGPTGSGKSTLVSLIARRYDVGEGKLTIDGIDVREHDLRELRAAIGFVPQASQLFSGTVRDNVELRERAASSAQLERALSLAQAAEFVRALPFKSETVLEHGGENLSGGQRQRLCIARALARVPRILILDDASSALDSRTESRLSSALRKLDRSTTIIVVSSRIHSVRDLDRILVLDQGRLVADGTHQTLLEGCAVYREILGGPTGGSASCPA